MKTTVEIADSLLSEAKRAAERQHTTVRALIEEGLRRVLEERKQRPGFRLRKASFRGQGFQAHVADGSWEKIRTLIYEGHGA
jgi:hypothetical protein